eukprot:396675_1
MVRTKATTRKGTGTVAYSRKPQRRRPVFLHQIPSFPCWAQMMDMLSHMSDKELSDILSPMHVSNHSTIMAPSVDTDCGSVGIRDPSKSSVHEPFSVALRHVHHNKVNGQYAARDFTVELKCGGKVWKLTTNIKTNCHYSKDCPHKHTYDCTYYHRDRYHHLYTVTCASGSDTMTKSFGSAEECYKEAQNELKAKQHIINLDWDRPKYKNHYLNLAIQMEQSVRECQTKQKHFAQYIAEVCDRIGIEAICDIIASFCNEDRLDYYPCDSYSNVFDEFRAPNTPIARLSAHVESVTDKTPSAHAIHLCERIYGSGRTFGKRIHHANRDRRIRVFSPQEMEFFATRIIKRLMKVEDENLKQIIFGDEEKRKMDDTEPSLKKRKLNNTNMQRVDEEIVIGHDDIYKVAYALSGSGVFEPTKQEIIWRHIFLLNEEQMQKVMGTSEGNRSLCILAFGLNAAAMNRGVVAQYYDRGVVAQYYN